MKLTRRKVLQIGAACLTGGAGYALGHSADNIQVRHQTLQLPRWKGGRIKIALLSDFHANSARALKRAKRAIDVASKEKPDFVVIPGDFVNYSTAPVLANLRAIADYASIFSCPVFATMGNHDYAVAEPEKVKDVLNNSTVVIMENEIVDLGGINVWGLDDALFGNTQYDLLGNDVPDSTIALLHEPDYVERMPAGVSLMVSGHTHGGQICLPGEVAIYAPKGGRRFVAGFYERTRSPLFVSRGIGSVIGDGSRFFCPPEVNILSLESA